MALYRSKLGPVGGGGGDGNRQEGGIVVDLDPLSAFALMSRGGGEESQMAAAAQAGSTRQTLVQPPVARSIGTVQSATVPKGNDTPLEVPVRHSRETMESSAGSRRASNGNSGVQAPSDAVVRDARYASLPGIHSLDRSGIPGPPPLDRRSSGISGANSPPLLNALRENAPFGQYKVTGLKTSTGGVEEGPGHDISAEKIDPLEVLRTEQIECLEGELLLVKLQNASVEGLHGQMVPGVLVMTTFKLLLIPHRPVRKGLVAHAAEAGSDERYFPFGHFPKQYLQVPMTCIDRVERDSDRKTTPRVDRYFNTDTAATIYCKDARRLRISFGGLEESERAMKMLQQLAFPGQMEHLFAFSHRTVKAVLTDPGWYIYNPQKEFDRMGVLKNRWNSASPWRTTDLNEKYSLCSSYPRVLVVPASVTDKEVEAISQFRSEQRLPVLCWGRQTDSASIWRSSQPKIGISRATCAEDEHMLARIAATSPSRTLPIVDCRPRSNATANFAAGYGYESYPDCPLEFAGIGNIHVMRESLAKLENLCLGSTSKDQEWNALVEDTRWLSHVRTVLASAWTVAFKAHTHRTPVLVHCSHGWDRTSQVCSLAQMLLDPYYRTMDGFQVLIEKDWLAFGHPFHLRHAYGLPRGVTSAKDDQRSPIFLQFLDCAWQLVMQLPSYFEFNPRYLQCIADHIHSCRFGTFLCNTNKARRDAGLDKRCGSLWTYLELHRPSFLSQLYHWDTREILLPPLPALLRHVRLWSDYFLRWSPAPSFIPLPIQLQDDIGSGSTSKEAKSGRGSGGSADAKEGTTRADSLPLFRCEFDEMERWVTLHGNEAERRRRVEASSPLETGRSSNVCSVDGSNSTPPSGGANSGVGADEGRGGEESVSQELAAAREEIKRLKTALASQDELVNILLANGAPSSSNRTKEVGTQQMEVGGEAATRDESVKGTAPFVGISGETIDASLAQLELLDDDDGDWALGRPRVHSSVAESREARRNSLSEMNAEEDRARCLTAVETAEGLDNEDKQNIPGDTWKWVSPIKEVANMRQYEMEAAGDLNEPGAASKIRVRGRRGRP